MVICVWCDFSLKPTVATYKLQLYAVSSGVGGLAPGVARKLDFCPNGKSDRNNSSLGECMIRTQKLVLHVYTHMHSPVCIQTTRQWLAVQSPVQTRSLRVSPYQYGIMTQLWRVWMVLTPVGTRRVYGWYLMKVWGVGGERQRRGRGPRVW